jgi:hypothetical protein
MFEAAAIDPVGRRDDVIVTAWKTASIWIVDFLSEVEIPIGAG